VNSLYIWTRPIAYLALLFLYQIYFYPSALWSSKWPLVKLDGLCRRSCFNRPSLFSQILLSCVTTLHHTSLPSLSRSRHLILFLGFVHTVLFYSVRRDVFSIDFLWNWSYSLHFPFVSLVNLTPGPIIKLTLETVDRLPLCASVWSFSREWFQTTQRLSQSSFILVEI
jgi:hypothetical protein